MNDRDATNPGEWEQANSAYLTSALAWLRLRLAWYAQQRPTARRARAAAGTLPGSRSPAQPALVLPRGLTGRAVGSAAARTGRAATGSGSARQPPVPTRHRGAADSRRIGHGGRRGAGTRHRPWSHSERLLGLSRFECDTLLLCVGAALDSSVRSLCAQAHGDPYPTFALALAALPDPAWDVLSPQRPLRHWRLVEVSRAAGQPLLSSPLQADERIVDHIKGLDYLDDRLEPLLTPLVRRPRGTAAIATGDGRPGGAGVADGPAAGGRTAWCRWAGQAAGGGRGRGPARCLRAGPARRLAAPSCR